MEVTQIGILYTTIRMNHYIHLSRQKQATIEMRNIHSLQTAGQTSNTN